MVVTMAGRAKSDKDSVSRLLPGLLRDRGWEKQLDLHSIFPRWREIVGDEVNEYAQPLKIERGVLWLEVANSSWLQQLQYEKLDLLDTLNRNFRLSKLHDIKMVLPKGKDDTSRSAKQESVTVVEFVRPSEEKIAAFRRQVECIADEKCREALMQFWYLAQACKRKKE
jgi:oligoribonuclease NrnB/cAMP/cGMP phosphodiesterase (DHH superfamily)